MHPLTAPEIQEIADTSRRKGYDFQLALRTAARDGIPWYRLVNASDAWGAPRPPKVPDFPHLPPDVAHSIAEFDAGIASGRIKMDSRGYPKMPPESENWIQEFLGVHIPLMDM